MVGFWLLCLMACEKDFKVDSKYGQNKLVINCLFDQYNLMNVYVTTSYNIGVVGNITTIMDARVEMYENDSLREVLAFHPSDSTGNFGYYVSTWYPTPGNKYTVKVITSKYGTATATDVMPLVASCTGQLISYPDTNDYTRPANLSITVTDAPGIDNYYRIGTYFFGDRMQIISPGDSVEKFVSGGEVITQMEGIADTVRESYNNYLFTDNTFKGSTITFGLQSSAPVANGLFRDLTFGVYFANLSKAAYQYFTTAQLARNTHNSNTAEPVFVYSNINNGYGIFCGMAVSGPQFVIK